MTVAHMQSHSAVKVLGYISGHQTELTIDTGAAVSLMDYGLFNNVQPSQLMDVRSIRILTAGGNEMKIAGTSVVEVSIGGAPAVRHTVLVAEGLTCPCLVGADFLRSHKCVIDFASGTLHIHNYEVKLKSERRNEHIIAITDSTSQDSTTHEVIKTMCADSTADDRTQRQLREMLLRYKDVISMANDDIGRTSVVRHRIRTGNAKPIKIGLRRTPHRFRPVMQTLIDRMLRQGVIERASSPWSFPVVLTTKKDGTQRFCVDYRKLNDVTEKDVQPLPRIDDAMDALAGSSWFSTLDLASGYWQVEVEPQDRPKTAFTTPTGSYQFRVMPFGLCNAPSTFQRLMEEVLAGLQWKTCLVYLDDIIVFAKTPAEQIERLGEVLNRLQLAGLKLKPSKCKVMTTEVLFLGHVISQKGISTDPSKCAAVERWNPPRCTNELRQFLAPLHRLLRKGQNWLWDYECQQAFQQLKQRLLSAPILRLPDFTKPFTLDVDASGEGIGAVLSQRYEDGEHPVAYASRALTKPERRYCATRRELLALVWACKHFRPYLYGARFSVRTDHNALIWLKSFREPEGQVARWLERLAEFDMEVTHRPGRLHDNADALSRQACNQCGKQVAVIGCTGVSPSLQQDDIGVAQNNDEEIKTLKEWICSNSWPNNCPEGVSRDFRILWGQKDALLLLNGTLYRRWENCNRRDPLLLLVVPTHMRAQILEQLHGGMNGGHLGKRRTLAKARSRFYWPGMAKDVDLWCKSCDTCARQKGHRRTRLPLQPLQAGYPFQRIGVDFLGPLPTTTTGKRYVLTVCDYFTKWAEAFATDNMEATTVAKVLTDNFVTRFGPPESVHSDQGRSFEARLMTELFQLLGIKKTRTTAYHPQSNGLVERFNRTLLDTLAALAEDSPERWDDMLPWATFAYNTSIHETTGITPFLALFGREARLPIDLQYDLPSNDHSPSVTIYVQELRKKLQDVHASVRQHAGMRQQQQKNYYDRRCHGNSFQQGDRVWLAVPRKGKISPRWDGPFVIKHRITEQIYRLDRRPKRDVIVHCDRLKQYDERPHHLTNDDRPTERQTPTGPSVPAQDCPTDLQAPLIPPRPRPTSPLPPPTPAEQTPPLTSPTILPPPIPSPPSRPVRQRRRPSRFRDYIIYASSFGRDGLD
ncbi:hypothetical protein M513_10788 [Trichuris suis]|uniref:RNA-directed DNA polymerase n=1 Tax=Trichuris suis TaxID=68888 RepID=A0A085LTK0_9BILA|nr:hypothetical protein M513_10788 [Trichuris suis]